MNGSQVFVFLPDAPGGKASQGQFLDILDERLRSIVRGKRKRAELRQIQQKLLKRGWHP
jgi:hypothetical protein